MIYDRNIYHRAVPPSTKEQARDDLMTLARHVDAINRENRNG